MSTKYRIVRKPGMYWPAIDVEAHIRDDKWVVVASFDKLTADKSEEDRIKAAEKYIRERMAGSRVIATFESAEGAP